jgi:penicillin-binding protein 1A
LAEKELRIRVGNRADGGVLYWVGKLFGFVGLLVWAAGVVAALVAYGYYVRIAPAPPDLARYAREAPSVSRMVAADGTLLGEFAREWRDVVALDEIPEPLALAFVAAEDHRFFAHHGLYFKGIARALWANFVRGDFAQGGSTITQQAAKQFVGSEKTLTRKILEAIVARRLEATYSKRAILALYLNHIYLGYGAYGVKAAARRYFSKDLDELTLGEMATIAGMARAPSHDSPVRSRERAQTRRDAVLDKMERHGFASAQDVAAARIEPLEPHPYDGVFGERSPYFAEHVRRYVVERHGEDVLLTRGLIVETTVDPIMDGAAYENVAFLARKQDKRQGWRGPVARLEGEGRRRFLVRGDDLYGSTPLAEGRRYLGLVERVDPRRALVRVGSATYELPIGGMQWAAPWSSRDATNDRTITTASQALRAGDVVWVSRHARHRGRFRDWILHEMNPHWQPEREFGDREIQEPDSGLPRLELEQDPHPQAAIFGADHGTGYVAALVGGHDYGSSEFNRAVQACRQPGSTYKPIYYSAALDAGYGFDTLLDDIPRAEVDPVTGAIWTPQNLHGVDETKVTLEYALVFSKNVPSVAIFKKVGADNVEAWARRLGFTTKIIADKALALGASCTRLDELTRAFGIFARNGRALDWIYVRRIRDRRGAVLEDNTVAYDPMLAPRERLDRLAATAGVAAPQAIPARTGFLTSKLLRAMVEHGFASTIRHTGLIAAGKTGTSSATMDTSFVGYTSRWITTVWLGDDLRVRPLGDTDAAYITVVPLWARYMVEVASEHPGHDIPWEVPAGVRRDDRGGNKGPQAAQPMPLRWPKHGADAETAPEG